MTEQKQQQGEGSYEGTREYNERTKAFLDKKGEDVTQLAKDAARALDSDEGAELRKAEDEARSHAED